ncbi:hypothetical protein HZB94_04275 [Candidatus Falkowbacteria bacterium]|nr:hypothetical protein [Candidatus Falkowbacteria bacterium]
MFRYFWLKFGLVVFSISLFFVCLIFLFLNHNDTLKNFVPEEAEIYLHSKPRQYNSLPANQRSVYLNWLEKHSSLSKSTWQSILQNHPSEIGLFSINGQVFGVVKSNKNAIDELNAQNVSFVQDGKATFFPALRLSVEKLTGNVWFRKINKKISFSDVLVYVKNISSLALPLPAFNSTEPLVASTNVAASQVKLRVAGPVGQKIELTNKRQIAALPSDTVIYFYNILTRNIPEKVEFLTKNFKFHLLQSMLGPVEYLETRDSFLIFASKKFNSLEMIKENILMILAQTLPVEKQKLLPDKTFSTQLIADPNQWQFQSTAIDNVQTLLNEPKIGLSLSIVDLGEMIAIKNKAQPPKLGFKTRLNSKINSCSLFHNNGAIILPLNAINGIEDIIIINKDESKIVVCIH